MNHVWKSAVVGVTALTLAGCAGLELQKAEKVEPVGSPFDNALAKNYVQISRDEYREGDYHDSDVFAVASMTAAQGSPVMPEDIGSRQLPEDAVGELSAARDRLMKALNANGRTKIPDESARAQACFDAWMQEQEENFQPDDIAARRDCFLDAIAKVEAALAAMPRQSFLVFFDWDKENLTPEALEIVRNAVASAKNMAPVRVTVTGHTDTSGSAEYNMGLSQRRANTVRGTMSRMGVPARSIRTIARGQSDPLVPTGDGVREPQNRRASILIEKRK